MRPCIHLVNYDYTHLLIALEPASAFEAHENIFNDLLILPMKYHTVNKMANFLHINFHLKLNSCSQHIRKMFRTKKKGRRMKVTYNGIFGDKKN